MTLAEFFVPNPDPVVCGSKLNQSTYDCCHGNSSDLAVSILVYENGSCQRCPPLKLSDLAKALFYIAACCLQLPLSQQTTLL